MSLMLRRLEAALMPYLHELDLAQCDRALFDDVSWLEYRANGVVPPYLLSIFHTCASRTVTAEAWRPEHVVEAVRQGVPDRAADRHHIWNYEEGADRAALVGEIVRTILDWEATRLQPTEREGSCDSRSRWHVQRLGR